MITSNQIKNRYPAAVALVGLYLPAMLFADWVKIDDFEGDTLTWTTSQTAGSNEDGAATLVDDPLVGAENQVLEIFPGTQAESAINNFRVYTSIPAIEFGSEATVFMRIAIPNVVVNGETITAQGNQVWGVTPIDVPTAWGDYSTATSFAFSGTFITYDGNQSTYVTVRETYSRDVWFSVWQVIRNVATGQQEYQVWAMGPGFGDVPTLVYPETDTYVPFRLKPDGDSDPAAAALDTFAFTTTTGTLANPAGIDPVYVDDIYIDLSGKNVTDPTGASTTTWAGFEVQDGYVSTGDFMGWLFVSRDPWVFSTALNKWIYLPEDYVREGGGWSYIPR